MASVHCKVFKAQSAFRPMRANGAIRLNPQSAMRKLQTRFRRSNLELRGPKNALKVAPRNSRG
eukprot:13736873-Alexandrium_andersonii.AAC.1